MLRKLIQLYAIYAREFSDVVARLGEHERDHGQAESEFLRLLEEIKRRHALCQTSREDLDRYIALPSHEPADVIKDTNEIRQETIEARERYKRADHEFRALTTQAYDVGLNHPDGVEA